MFPSAAPCGAGGRGRQVHLRHHPAAEDVAIDIGVGGHGGDPDGRLAGMTSFVIIGALYALLVRFFAPRDVRPAPLFPLSLLYPSIGIPPALLCRDLFSPVLALFCLLLLRWPS